MATNSVHLTSFPNYTTVPFSSEVVYEMNLIRSICNAILSIRNANNAKVRIPLSSVTIFSQNPLFKEDCSEIIKNETNVKNVLFAQNLSDVAEQKVFLNLKLCGQLLGSRTAKIMQMVNGGHFNIEDDGSLTVDDLSLTCEYFDVRLLPRNVDNSKEFAMISLDRNHNLYGKVLVHLCTNITDDLKVEGFARDLGRIIQQSRKNCNFSVHDRINIKIATNNTDFIHLLKNDMLRQLIEKQTLSTFISIDDFDTSESWEALCQSDSTNIQKFSKHLDENNKEVRILMTLNL